MQAVPNRPQRNILIVVFLLIAAMALATLSLLMVKDPVSGSGKALIGGSFTAINHKGEPVTEKTFAGKYMLVFFGYTYCPDVCPTELQVMTAALQQLGPAADKITPVFVSIDPDRDTPEVMAAYVSNFDPRLVGLTGTAQQITALAKTYRVYFAKVENKASPADYLMDHTSIVYLMGPDGSFQKHFTYSTDAKVLADEIRQVIEKQQ
jgi:cytochrome oxidase Cu insertion factor (SCO1/SenC/PrrC family)